MSSKDPVRPSVRRPPTSRARSRPASAPDALTLVKGIGPGVAQQLRKAGIQTLVQLGAMSAPELSALVPELRRPRAVKLGWIREARRLSAEPSSAMIAEPRARGHQHYATFTVELLLADGNNVRRTRVTHVQSGEEETWAGWDEKRLLALFRRAALLKTDAGCPGAVTASVVPKSTAVELSQEGSSLGLREMEISRDEEDEPRTLLTAGRPFLVRLRLEPMGLAADVGAPVECSVQVWAKSLAGPRSLAGESLDPVAPAGPTPVTIRCAGLASGAYRFEAVARLHVDMGRGRPAPAAVLTSEVLHIC